MHQCTVCSAVYKHRASLRRHMGITHKMNEAGQPFTAEEIIAFQKRSINAREKNRVNKTTTKPLEEDAASTVESDDSYTSESSHHRFDAAADQPRHHNQSITSDSERAVRQRCRTSRTVSDHSWMSEYTNTSKWTEAACSGPIAN